MKDTFGVEEYVASWVSHEAVSLGFWPRTNFSELFQDKRRCQMCVVGRCVLCNRGEVEDVRHFVLN